MHAYIPAYIHTHITISKYKGKHINQKVGLASSAKHISESKVTRWNWDLCLIFILFLVQSSWKPGSFQNDKSDKIGICYPYLVALLAHTWVYANETFRKPEDGVAKGPTTWLDGRNFNVTSIGKILVQSPMANALIDCVYVMELP